MKKNIIAALTAILIAPLLAVLGIAASAQAITCLPGTSICTGGKVARSATDNGYDRGMVIFCDYGDAFPSPNWNRDKRVFEGQSSKSKCGTDTDVVWVRYNEEIWCRAGDTGSGGYVPMTKQFDARGAHKINDLVDLRSCQMRRD